jgi:hypothetical protein
MVDTRRGAGLGIYALYRWRERYGVRLLGDYLVAVDGVWTACDLLAWYRHPSTRARAVWERARDFPSRPSADPNQAVFYVDEMRIGSPMVITFAVDASIASVAVYATFLTARVLRDPERIGAWIPRLVAGWHHGMKEAERSRSDRGFRAAEQEKAWRIPGVQELIKASTQLRSLELRPDEVSVIAPDDTPADLAEADDFDQS